MIDSAFWKGKKVFITGHTGFKGAWLCLWLHALGAEVTGYALGPPTEPSLFRLAAIDGLVTSLTEDVRNAMKLTHTLRDVRPDIVIHMAAQPLVRDSYNLPVETYHVNVMGTVHLFEAIRSCSTVRAVVNVTTDKCYENREWLWGYRENEALGGFDPYSSSKACSELVTAAYRSSYFPPAKYAVHGVAVASARAGNVIGGGDWAADRLVPDWVRSTLKGDKMPVRSPRAIRPWQFVLDPLAGYLVLAQKLFLDGSRYAEAWNFGPDDTDARPVEWIISTLCRKWGQGASYTMDPGEHPHEAQYLKLDCSKARTRLNWHPIYCLDRTLDVIIEWTRAYRGRMDLREVCLRQIEDYTGSS